MTESIDDDGILGVAGFVSYDAVKGLLLCVCVCVL